jgi:chromatin assembly factor 1 subunit B
MKAKCINIKWSSSETKEPISIYSLDFHSSGLLVTGAGDRKIQVISLNPSINFKSDNLNQYNHNIIFSLCKIWKIQKSDNVSTIKNFGFLCGHQSVNINCVRFSPCGRYLASGADYGELCVWKTGSAKANNKTRQVVWSKKVISWTPSDDILDLCWSKDSSSIAIASVNNTVVVCDTISSDRLAFFNHHKNIVQEGVSWDPCGLYLASESADRSCHIYRLRPRQNKVPSISKEEAECMVFMTSLPQQKKNKKNYKFKTEHSDVIIDQKVRTRPQKDSELVNNGRSMFLGEEGPMFRRLSWSPDGSFLAIPSGIYQEIKSSFNRGILYTTYLFSRIDWSKPLGHFPAVNTPTSVTSWCPVLFKNQDQLSKKKYRMYLAVSSKDSVFIYDTESMKCVSFVGGLHLASITDLSWSKNGTRLAVSSRDGFCR